MERVDYEKSSVAMYQSPPSAASMDNPFCDVVHTKSGPRSVTGMKTPSTQLETATEWT